MPGARSRPTALLGANGALLRRDLEALARERARAARRERSIRTRVNVPSQKSVANSSLPAAFSGDVREAVAERRGRPVRAVGQRERRVRAGTRARRASPR